MHKCIELPCLKRRKRRKFRKISSNEPNQVKRKKRKKKVPLFIPSVIRELIASYIPYDSLIEGLFDVPRQPKYSYKFFGTEPIVICQDSDIYGPVPVRLFEQTVWEYRVNSPDSNLGTVLYGMNFLSNKYHHEMNKKFRNEVLVEIFSFFSLVSHGWCGKGFKSLITNEEPTTVNLRTIESHWEDTWKGKIIDVLDENEGEQMVINGSGIVAAKMIMGIRDDENISHEVRQSAREMYEKCLQDPWFQECSDIE